MKNLPVIIGIAGAHSTGKTSLAHRIEAELRAQNVNVTRASGLTQRATVLGFPTMLGQTAASAEWMITAGAADVLTAGINADVVLVDRTPYDALAYLHTALHHRSEQPAAGDLETLSLLADVHTRRHALVLATVLDPGLPLGERPRTEPAYADPVLRAAVDHYLHALLSGNVPADRLHAVAFDQHDAAVKAAVTAVHHQLAALG